MAPRNARDRSSARSASKSQGDRQDSQAEKLPLPSFRSVDDKPSEKATPKKPPARPDAPRRNPLEPKTRKAPTEKLTEERKAPTEKLTTDTKPRRVVKAPTEKDAEKKKPIGKVATTDRSTPEKSSKKERGFQATEQAKQKTATEAVPLDSPPPKKRRTSEGSRSSKNSGGSLFWPIALALFGLLLCAGLYSVMRSPSSQGDPSSPQGDLASSANDRVEPLIEETPKDLEVRPARPVDQETEKSARPVTSGVGSAYQGNDSGGGGSIEVLDTMDRERKRELEREAAAARMAASGVEDPALKAEAEGRLAMIRASAMKSQLEEAEQLGGNDPAAQENAALAAKMEAERKAAEEKAALAAKMEAEKKAAEEKAALAAKMEAEKKATEEKAALAAKMEAEKKAAEEKAALAAKMEAEKKATEEEAALASKIAMKKESALLKSSEEAKLSQARASEEAERLGAAVAGGVPAAPSETPAEFVTTYIESGNSNIATEATSFFAEKVTRYFTKVDLSREQLLADRRNYIKTYPKRSYQIQGAPKSRQGQEGQTLVDATFDYTVSDGEKTYEGSSSVLITLRETKQKGWEIVAVQEQAEGN